MEAIYREQLPNGLWLLGEPIEAAQSLSMNFLLPAGTSQEPADRLGVSSMLAEMMIRGAGGLTGREHSEALERLGVQRDTAVHTRHIQFSATMIGAKLGEALPLLTDMVRRPNLSEDALEPSRALCVQSIDALADEPQQRVMLEIQNRHHPAPLDRSPLGQREHLVAMSLEDVRAFQQRCFVPTGSILAFAGNFDWEQLRARVIELLGDWEGAIDEAKPAEAPQRGYAHHDAKTTQVHIGLAYDAVPESSEDSMKQRAAAAVLSGGMSSRLFTEVREKRGLCYAVMAAYAAQRDRGAMLGYAGTTSERAQDTLDVFVGELKRLSRGVEQSEFDRAVVGMKSRLVMQGESTRARAGAIARDQFVLGRPRPLAELEKKVDELSVEQLNAFVAAHPPTELTIVTIGPSQLRVE
ncbi:MAG: M16 family metallopeptidase [Phycisphaeraceae bacterium]